MREPTLVSKKEIRWETSKGEPPSLQDVVKTVRKHFPRKRQDQVEILATGFEGRDVLYRAVVARVK